MPIKEIQVFLYGLPRGVINTHDGINLLLKNLENVTRYSVFIKKSEYSNPRTGEFGEKINFDDAKRLLSIDYQTLLPPEENSLTDSICDFRKYGNAFDDNGNSLSNLIEQLTTLKKCSEIYISKHASAYIFVRPDVLYYGPLLLDKLDSKSIYLPKWQSYGGYNDRFAVTKNYDAAVAYANRLDDALDYCVSNGLPLHSESLLNFSLLKRKIQVRGLPIRFSRVRNHGKVEDENFSCDMWKTRIRNFIRTWF